MLYLLLFICFFAISSETSKLGKAKSRAKRVLFFLNKNKQGIAILGLGSFCIYQLLEMKKMEKSLEKKAEISKDDLVHINGLISVISGEQDNLIYVVSRDKNESKLPDNEDVEQNRRREVITSESIVKIAKTIKINEDFLMQLVPERYLNFIFEKIEKIINSCIYENNNFSKLRAFSTLKDQKEIFEKKFAEIMSLIESSEKLQNHTTVKELKTIDLSSAFYQFIELHTNNPDIRKLSASQTILSSQLKNFKDKVSLIYDQGVSLRSAHLLKEIEEVHAKEKYLKENLQTVLNLITRLKGQDETLIDQISKLQRSTAAVERDEAERVDNDVYIISDGSPECQPSSIDTPSQSPASTREQSVAVYHSPSQRQASVKTISDLIVEYDNKSGEKTMTNFLEQNEEMLQKHFKENYEDFVGKLKDLEWNEESKNNIENEWLQVLSTLPEGGDSIMSPNHSTPSRIEN